MMRNQDNVMKSETNHLWMRGENLQLMSCGYTSEYELHVRTLIPDSAWLDVHPTAVSCWSSTEAEIKQSLIREHI